MVYVFITLLVFLLLGVMFYTYMAEVYPVNRFSVFLRGNKVT